MRRRTFPSWGAVAVAALVAALGAPRAGASVASDFVFIVEATSPMAEEIGEMRTGLAGFAQELTDNDVDARFALVLFGGAPELVLDFTSSMTSLETAFSNVSTTGAVSGFQRDHNLDPEAGLEAIRIVLGAAATSGGDSMWRTNVGGSGDLAFRSDAVKNLILLTGQDSDSPYWAANRASGQDGYGGSDGYSGSEPPSIIAGTGWQTEVDNTAQALIDAEAMLNMWVNDDDIPAARQYSDPDLQSQDADYGNFSASQTLVNLVNAGIDDCVQGQLLSAGVMCRAFDVYDIANPGAMDSFYEVKVAETVPEPVTLSLVAAGLALLAARRRRR